MTLHLDTRRLAMLREMGLRLLPAFAPVEAPVPAGGQSAAAERPAPAAPQAGAIAAVRNAVPAVPEGMDWDALQAAVASCQACGLCGSRSSTVFGVGPPRADWLVVGDAPDEEAEARGEPFAGDAGKLLDNMLRPLGLDRRRNVYITNLLKCRPPGNRNPDPAELAQCEPFLRRQVELLQPRMILAMGRFSVQALLQTTEPIGRLRGRAHAYHGVPVVVTYHPAYLLRNLADKGKAWADLCLALDLVGAQA